MSFGGLVDEARKGRMSRRGFLAAALALGVGGDDALGALKRPTQVAVIVSSIPELLQHLLYGGPAEFASAHRKWRLAGLPFPLRSKLP